MKLAAVEGLYEGGNSVGIVGVGVLNPDKETYNDGKEPLLFEWKYPVCFLFSPPVRWMATCPASKRLSREDMKWRMERKPFLPKKNRKRKDRYTGIE